MKNKKKKHLLKTATSYFLTFAVALQPLPMGMGTALAAEKQTQQTDYSKYSNQKISFGLGLRTDHKVPSGDRPSGVKLKDYNAYYYDIHAKKNDPVVYLTFDCGYENGYTEKILDTLKETGTKAIFFVTESYIKSAPKIVKRMKKEGHLVGNHTSTHTQLTSCSVARIKKEIRQCAKTMKELTGYSMDQYVRPPEGVYSERVLKVLQDMGYATFLWSLAYYDYDESKQPGKSYVIEKFKKHHFNGMIPLIHAVSKSNAEALPDVIAYLKKQGYRLGTVDEITGDKVAEEEADYQAQLQ
jgi:peptidoglycan-N-acetylmuramic acid deacetylase